MPLGPRRRLSRSCVTSAGGRYRFDDDQETPDTHLVSFNFEGKKSITWDGMSCINRPEDRKAEVIFYGEKGSLAIAGKGYTIYDLKGKTVRKEDRPRRRQHALQQLSRPVSAKANR